MEKDYIINSLQTQRLQLDLFEKIKYFKVPGLCLFVSLMSITNGFQQFSNVSFDEDLTKISLIFLIISLISFKLKYNRLKMIILDNPDLNFRSRILNLAEKRNWEMEKNEERAMILKTIPVKTYDHYFNSSYNKDTGERIFLFFEQNKIYLKSIDNLNFLGFKIHKGNNLENEKILALTIKASG